jgi:hypothetical protein
LVVQRDLQRIKIRTRELPHEIRRRKMFFFYAALSAPSRPAF